VLAVDDRVGGIELTRQCVCVWVREEVVGECVVEVQLCGQPVGQRLEATAQHGEGEAKAFEEGTEFLRAGRDCDFRFQAFEDIAGDALEQGDSRFQAGGEVKLTVHGAGGDGGDLGFDADVGGDLVDYFLLNKGGVHVEDT
jgi:hypothetical protein